VALLAEPGEAFLEKQSAARLSALAAALLFGLFLLGVAGLAAASRRDARDAERKATFVSQVSHELRTPLTSIRMFADMLGNPALPQEKRLRFAGTISRESRRLGALIERLLAFAALEKGRHPVVLEVVDVADLARETMEEAEVSLGASGLRIEAGWPEEPALARTDRSMVKQALLDLLDNAAKYASGGGVVRLGLSVDGAWLRLRVADRGPGIPAAVRSRLFEPFVQGDRTLTDASSGVGLGLSIARGLLRAAGGDLVLLPSSEGATFEIRLPAARLSAPRDGATAGPAEDVSPSNLSRTP
jgi:signal transduction histidine kinase